MIRMDRNNTACGRRLKDGGEDRFVIDRATQA
jgi:hypothetical protein